jgi:hypothetical protein
MIAWAVAAFGLGLATFGPKSIPVRGVGLAVFLVAGASAR